MRRPDEVRDPAELYSDPFQLSDDEADGALALLVTMTIEALEQIVEAKREHRALPEAPEAEELGAVLDLMAG